MKTKLYNEIKNLRLKDLILSPGHFNFFLSDKSTEQKITNDLRTLRTYGISYYLHQEYPESSGKAIILNKVKGAKEIFIIDGNRHIFTLYFFSPGIKIKDIYQLNPGCLRIWDGGFETDSQQSPFEIWIPLEVDTTRIPQVKIVTDHSKSPSVQTKSISPDIKFNDSALFTHSDIGRNIASAAVFFKIKHLMPKVNIN